VVALTLPGLDPDDPDRATRTLDDQAAAIEQTLAHLEVTTEHPATLVAHSGANAPVSLVLDRHPELIGRMIWVDSGPMANGTAFAPDFPEELTELPLPPFDVLAQQASLEGLTPEMLDRLRARAVPEPAPVLRQTVELTNDARHAVPTTLVCCSISTEQVLEMAQAGHLQFTGVANLTTVDVVDLPTGHWPMWSRTGRLCQAILACTPGPSRSKSTLK
jgi:pimeloyl-ACP methyl ester carboxylesterase